MDFRFSVFTCFIVVAWATRAGKDFDVASGTQLETSETGTRLCEDCVGQGCVGVGIKVLRKDGAEQSGQYCYHEKKESPTVGDALNAFHKYLPDSYAVFRSSPGKPDLMSDESVGLTDELLGPLWVFSTASGNSLWCLQDDVPSCEKALRVGYRNDGEWFCHPDFHKSTRGASARFLQEVWMANFPLRYLWRWGGFDVILASMKAKPIGTTLFHYRPGKGQTQNLNHVAIETNDFYGSLLGTR